MSKATKNIIAYLANGHTLTGNVKITTGKDGKMYAQKTFAEGVKGGKFECTKWEYQE